jgi:hypothetical protein
MQPDRSNYEIWLTDWLDGSLDKDQTEMLMVFLKQNPDIKEEADFLVIAKLAPANDSFPEKESLKKNISALTSGQVELLSVAFLENDLNPEQESELNQCLAQNPEYKKIYNTIQRIQLMPSDEVYPGKNNLLKQTAGSRILRLSIVTMSAAATIALFILAITFGPSLFRKNDSLAEQIIVPDTSKSIPLTVRTKVFRSPSPAYQISKILPETPDIQVIAEVQTDSSIPDIERVTGYRVTNLPVISCIPQPLYDEFSLIALNIPLFKDSYYDDRNAFTRFLARNFREKILRDEKSGDAPIKPMEFAEAGVEGLNKLLGWEMSLVAVNDEAGELKSVYFDSRMLKFNAPVKNNETDK